jgi:ketosteroid isomerase-like protein
MNTMSSELSTDQKAAEIVARKYMDFLHSANTDGIMSLYDDDAVFLPADAPTVVGKAKIRESYTANFKVMNIPDGDSTLEEATIHGDFAVVRLATRSTILILASNQKIVNDARELFVLKRVGAVQDFQVYVQQTMI